MSKNKFVFFMVVVFFFGLVASAQASLYLSSGQHTFWVSVRNSSFKDIRDARGYVYITGTSARIEVQAPGYRNGSTYVNLPPNTFQHNANVRLDDTMVMANIRDNTGGFVQGAYVNTYNQSMYWGEEFGMQGYLPKAGFASLTPRLIEVRVNGMWAFAPRIYLTSAGDRWNIEVVVKRSDMNSFSNNIDLVVAKDGSRKPVAFSQADIAELAKDYRDNTVALGTAEATAIELLKNRLESISHQLQQAFIRMDEGEKRSLIQAVGSDSSFGRELLSISTFEQLQK